MARKITERLSIITDKGDSYNFNIIENYSEIYTKKQVVDNSNGFISLVETSSSIAANALSGAKALVIKNSGIVSTEIQISLDDYKNNSDIDDANSVDLGPGSATIARQSSFILAAGEYIFFPNLRWVSYAEAASAANAKPTTNGAYLSLDSNEYVDSGADVDDGSGLDIIGSASETKVFIEQWTSVADNGANLFHVGDLIRVNDEIMEVTAIGSKADLANTYLTVIRGSHGSTAASDHADDAAIRLPFFNAYHEYDKFTVTQTDSQGRFKAMNFFGFGRVQDSTSDGIVAGSIAGKFYEAGYQSFGLQDITGSTSSGLAVSTTYGFNITVDGGTEFVDLSFTTDASNVKFGGNNGILRKIQNALDIQYYTAGYLFEKKVSVNITNGDVRFTSGQRLSTSAISLANPGSVTNIFGVGRVPVIGSINDAVTSKLPSDTIIDYRGVSKPNLGAFFYDDGHGRILGSAQGSINYSTGVISFVGPASAEFAITANYDSAHGGGTNTTSGSANVIKSISARSCNSKIDTTVELISFS